MFACVYVCVCLCVMRNPAITQSDQPDLTWTSQIRVLRSVMCELLTAHWLVFTTNFWWSEESQTQVSFLSYNLQKNPVCFIVDDLKWFHNNKNNHPGRLYHTHTHTAQHMAEQPEGVQQLGLWSVILSHLYSSPFWTLSTFLCEAATNEWNITTILF